MASKMPRWFTDEMEGKEVGVKVKANKQEKDFAKRVGTLGGRRQPASGALWSAKGDVKIGDIALGDNKQTKYNSFSITKDMWKKIADEAVTSNKQIPFLQIEMNDCTPLVVLSENDFIMLLEQYIMSR